MSRHAKTLELVEMAIEVLTGNRPMTVRQVYYQLVSRQVIENNRCQYQAVSNALVAARKTCEIPWNWIEDRLRRPRRVSMWSGLADFAETAKRAYRRDVWAVQPGCVECWLEKDALSGIFEDALKPYGVTLNVGRGYDGWDSIHNAAERYGSGEDTTVLYFGDFDPSGEDMVRSLRERLAFFESTPEIKKCALTAEDVTRYDLPPDFTKKTDTRRAAFIAKYGDRCVELDALPVEVLRERIIAEVEARMDLDELATLRRTEERERDELVRLLARETNQ
jgi:Type IIB DNA topoisomerase